jgi:hypothetical protein
VAAVDRMSVDPATMAELVARESGESALGINSVSEMR